MNSKQVVQIVKPDPIFTNRSTSLVYTLRLSGEDKYVLTMEAGPNPYLFSSDSSIERTDRKTTVLPLGPREPVFIYEEVDIEEWKKALDYDESKIDGLLHEILFDFNISATDENIKWLRKQIDELVLSYENSYNVKLPAATRAMVYKLIVLMAYDKLCIKSST